MAASSRRFPLRSSLSTRRVLRNLVAFALLYGAGLAAVWGFSLLGVSTLVAFPVFVLGALSWNSRLDACRYQFILSGVPSQLTGGTGFC